MFPRGAEGGTAGGEWKLWRRTVRFQRRGHLWKYPLRTSSKGPGLLSAIPKRRKEVTVPYVSMQIQTLSSLVYTPVPASQPLLTYNDVIFIFTNSLAWHFEIGESISKSVASLLTESKCPQEQMSFSLLTVGKNYRLHQPDSHSSQNY